ncbi:hypothetical protein AVEN_268837-1 [Araneus ventricosus]|uniref:Uncharacterized protein n=1 Tax=Araneus ventricosus TaxID=182803 RepID=A0A4Y2L9E3_ARAVE|nr:hypothetical protein AVEN_268837-1 [Araneus ventricosus]
MRLSRQVFPSPTKPQETRLLRQKMLAPWRLGIVWRRSSARPSPRVRRPTGNERFMVKEESAASVETRPWMPEGRSLTLPIAFML